jgi:NADH:ubiquinone oxidoreductase subunit E
MIRQNDKEAKTVWNLQEALDYYKKQGAPGDQTALIALLREVQEEHGGIPAWCVEQCALSLKVKESFLLAVIRRIPGLRLMDRHVLELCAGPNCGKHTHLAALAEKLATDKVTVKFVPCMRMCGKGPNLKWDGKLFHGADEALLRRLLEGEKET